MTVKKIILSHKFKYFKALLFKSTTELLNIAMAFIFGALIQGAVKKDYEQLKIGVILSLILLLLLPVLEFFSNLVVSKLNQEIMYEVRQRILDSYMNSEPEKFKESDNGSKLSVLTNDIDALYSDFLVNIFWIWHYAFMLISTIISLIFISVYMAGVLITLTIISFYFSTKGVGDIEKVNEKRLNALSNHTNAMNEFISGYEVVHDFKLQDYSHIKMKDLFRESIKKYVDYRKFVLRQESIGMFFGGIVFMGGFIAGSVFVYYSLLSIGLLITSIQLSNNLNQPIFNLVSLVTQFKASKNTIEKLDSILENGSTKYSKSESKKLENYDLSFQKIKFNYPNSNFSLGPIDSKICYGKKICILGHSGSGKSTVLKLLKKDILPVSGELFIGDESYNNISTDNILDSIGIISQNVFIFKSSIRNNISLFDDKIDREKIKKSMVQVGLEKFIDKMDDPNFVEELGGSLSGGERQRVSIARCLVRNRPIIIADEAFSSLDNKLAFEIESELLNIEENTFINITHRLFPKNLSKYDEIWVLSNGELVTKGHYSDIKDDENLVEFIKDLH